VPEFLRISNDIYFVTKAFPIYLSATGFPSIIELILADLLHINAMKLL